MSERTPQPLWRLFATAEPACLGPQRRDSAQPEATVRTVVAEALRAGWFQASRQPAILALLLLWHDHLDASHAISQGIETAEGSFLHAMMHRREPDYGNSKYWWRRTGQHPAFAVIGQRAAEYLHSEDQLALSQSLLRDSIWKPAAFVDACEAAADQPLYDPLVAHLRQLQQIEFEVMLERLTAG